MPPHNMLISYIAAAAFLRHALKDFLYFAAFAKTKKIIFLNVNSPHKNKVKDKKRKPSVLYSGYIYYMRRAMVCMMCTLSCYEGSGDMLPTFEVDDTQS